MLGVVIPAYKRKDCLRKTLASLTLQTKKSFYVIVVDDHSPEPLKDVVEAFKGQFHLKYIYLEKNGGPGIARQVGLNYCYEHHFKFVVFLDSDDYLFPHALARLYREINLESADIVSANFCVENKEGINHIKHAENITFVHSKIYRTSFLKENNITFPSLRTNEDLAFNLKAIETAKKVKLLDEELHLFHSDPNSITRCGDNDRALEVDYIEALYDAFLFLEERNIPTDHLSINLINCYNTYQMILLSEQEPSQEMKEHLRWLLSYNQIPRKLRDTKFLMEIGNIIQQVVVVNGELRQFPQTFNEWLKYFTSDMDNNANSSKDLESGKTV